MLTAKNGVIIMSFDGVRVVGARTVSSGTDLETSNLNGYGSKAHGWMMKLYLITLDKNIDVECTRASRIKQPQ